MGLERFKKLYDSLLECDDLHLMFRGMTGEWEKDKNRFIKLQQEMEKELNFKDEGDNING